MKNARRNFAKVCWQLYSTPCSPQFVAHPNVQQLLASIWYEGLPGFRQKNMVLQVRSATIIISQILILNIAEFRSLQDWILVPVILDVLHLLSKISDV